MLRLRWLLLSLPLVGWAEHAVLHYELPDSGTQLTLTHLPGQPSTYQVEGLPFPGEVLWRPGQQALAYRHPTEGSWLLATPSLLPPSQASTTSLPGAPGPNTQGQTTRRWAQSVAGQGCGVLFGAPGLAQQYDLNIGDFQHLYRLLYWLNTAQLPQGCTNAQTLAATAPQIGLPTRWASPLGLMVFQAVQLPPEGTAPLTWPSLTYPVTPDVQLRLLLAQLPIAARGEFIRQNATLPLALQVEKLAALLAAQAQEAP